QNNLFFNGDEAIMSGLFFSVCEFSELMMVSFEYFFNGHEACRNYALSFTTSYSANNSLTSTIFPLTAAAAAVSGLASIVRAFGPWRPSKFLLDVETQYFPAGILSSFIPKQAEQPGSRSIKPASSNILSIPSSFACAST